MAYTLKQWRAIRNMSQEQLAEAISRTSMTISLWETGKSEPKYSDLIKLSQVLNTNGIDNIILPINLS